MTMWRKKKKKSMVFHIQMVALHVCAQLYLCITGSAYNRSHMSK